MLIWLQTESRIHDPTGKLKNVAQLSLNAATEHYCSLRGVLQPPNAQMDQQSGLPAVDEESSRQAAPPPFFRRTQKTKREIIASATTCTIFTAFSKLIFELINAKMMIGRPEKCYKEPQRAEPRSAHDATPASWSLLGR